MNAIKIDLAYLAKVVPIYAQQAWIELQLIWIDVKLFVRT